MNTVIFIPTYNEKDNIEEVIKRIRKIDENLSILIVDDNSPDGTSNVAGKYASEDKNISLVKMESRKGRGVAGKQAYKFALDNGFDALIEMDGDLSHDPIFIPDMLNHAKDYDVVIGSRYIGGGFSEERVFIRRLISKCTNFYLRFLLGGNLKDYTSGYRLLTRIALEGIDIASLKSNSPSIIFEVLNRCIKKGYRIKEVPIRYVERKRGSSKLNFTILIRSFFLAIKFRFWRG